MADLPPVHFFSHGTTMVLGERSNIADYWKKCGDDALAHNIKGVIIMGAHWNCPKNTIQVSMNPNPTPQSVAFVEKSKYSAYKPNPDLATGQRCLKMLQAAGFEAEEAPKFDWLIDTFPLLVRMFPSGCPPVTIVSQNSYFDPYFHTKMGTVLRPLRKEGYLFIGSGGGVHNLFRAEWKYMIQYRDTFALERAPDPPQLEFRQALEDVICRNGGGPELRAGIIRLMKHPYFRDAHGTDEHYMSACFLGGLIGDEEDHGAKGVLGAECWELRNQGETQFTIGSWPSGRVGRKVGA
ncbi:hypothetical protein MMC13_001255 [Lambiella insularis]|nr:hypothetical protein [Lambiella insularis]